MFPSGQAWAFCFPKKERRSVSTLRRFSFAEFANQIR
jgi:hypothetical protein